MSTTLTLPRAFLPSGTAVAPVRSLDYYVNFAYSVPMLEATEERELAERLKLHNDIQAAHQLVLSHLRFVVKIARSFNGYGLQLADLIQEGTIGLMKAVKRFDPAMGVRLASFAVHWIKAEIHEFVIKNWRIVKIATTKAQRKLFFNLRSAKKRLGWFTQEEIAEVAAELKVKPAEVIEMEQRLNAIDASFDAPEEESDDHSFSPIHYLPAPDASPEIQVIEEQSQKQAFRLQNQLEKLDARSQDIIAQRWLAEDKATLEELAAKYQISAERVRQLETQALQKLKQALKKAA